MSNKIFKNDHARKRMENWYQRFLGRVEGGTSSKEISTSYGKSHVLTVGDSFNDFATNLKIPPLASEQELKNLTMLALVIGAEKEFSFPGDKIIERAKAYIPNVQTELIKDSRHSPPTTPEFRNWLAELIKSFIS